jgi:hypothetical protein
LVFDIFKENALEQAVKGESMGTLVYWGIIIGIASDQYLFFRKIFATIW